MIHRQRDNHSAVRPPVLWAILAVTLAGLALGSVGIANQDQPDPLARQFREYCQFFGLDQDNPATVANTDPDGDGLTCWQESGLTTNRPMTDPLEKDSDGDGFADNIDADPVSRACLWKSPRFVQGEQYDYLRPDWCLAAYRTEGHWATLSPSQQCWQVSASAPAGQGQLSVDLDRRILTNDLVYALQYWGSTNATLYVSLLDTNGAYIAQDLFGNIISGSNQVENTWMALPLAAYPRAAVVQLRRGTGELKVFYGQLYIDEDADGLDQAQERQLFSSDRAKDSNGDGIDDYDSVFRYGINPGNGNGGSYTNQPGPWPTPAPTNRPPRKSDVIFVDKHNGSDLNDGGPDVGLGRVGPKLTIRGGMEAAQEAIQARRGGTVKMVIRPGEYHESLDLRGNKHLKVTIVGDVKL